MSLILQQKIDWKPVYQEPEDYGTYLVKVRDKKLPTLALFDHPNGERETGWYKKSGDGYVRLDVTHWDTAPILVD